MSIMDWLNTLGWLEWSAFITGVICVFLIVIEKDANWPIGVINSALLIWCFWTQKLWATVGLQVFYTVECLYGWWMWTRRDKSTGIKLIRIGNTGFQMILGLVVLTAIGTASIYPILLHFDDPYPLTDGFIGVASLAAEYLLCLKLRQGWTVYFFLDFLTMYILYVQAKFGPAEYRNVAIVTLAQYFFYVFLCLAGMFEWRRRLKANWAKDNLAIAIAVGV